MSTNLTKLILSEIYSFDNVLKKVFEYKILNESGCLERQYPVNTNYFTILETNACKLEQIENQKLMELIIHFYVSAKYFFDCIRANNELIEEYNNLNTQSEIKEADSYLLEFKNTYLKPAFLELSYTLDNIKKIENI